MSRVPTKLTTKQQFDVTYFKRGEKTQRVIIPTYVPHNNIKAIDITELTEQERDEMLSLWTDYQGYLETVKNTTFSFEDHIKQVSGKDISPKWRTFKIENLSFLTQR